MDDNEIKRRLAGRAAEYMMFKDDEEDTEAPAEISLSEMLSTFQILKIQKTKFKVTSKVTTLMSLWNK